ncbi:transposase [Crocosphaera sp. XPORK-15E]|uniref:transposase n=1 Tax=Crocosphaera sp. XPORK-15E TaxID=3110247 RepID=UPI002B1F1052|nr:transposase [Crocosphaera sp. XPORK-15E]MEA5534285.1 transposase [Crocosphaera sp. XPORK-15E]
MAHNPDFSHRRSIRIKEYNYADNGAYFVTLCTKNKQCIFADIKQGKIKICALGAIAHNCWLKISEHFPHVILDVFVIMPNHVHGILWLNNSQKPVNEARSFGNIVAGSLSSVIRSYKAAVTKEINYICGQKGTSLVWQRNYYEHIIRDEKALQEIRKYIVENPLNWDKDPEYSLSREILLDLPF